MWAALRRILNRPATNPGPATASTSRHAHHIGPPRQPQRPSSHYGHQRPGSQQGNQRPDSQQGNLRPGNQRRPAAPDHGHPANQGRFVGVHRAPHASHRPTLRPWHVRDRRFHTRWRGLDPAEVDTFLNQVATDLATVYAQLGAAREETQRVKDALRRWQTAQAPSAYELAAAEWTGVRR